MVLVKRMKTLKEIFHVRVGPGSAILPRDVTKIHMTFSPRWEEGHWGARQFWKVYLPRLKYHNPAVSVIADRKPGTGANAEMLIHFAAAARSARGGAAKVSAAALVTAGATGGPESAAVAGAEEALAEAEAGEVMKIDLQSVEEADIYKRFLEATRAEPIQHTEEEMARMQEYEDTEKRRAVDRRRQKAAADKKAAEELMEKKARAAAAAAS